jgi:hypothetical protein
MNTKKTIKSIFLTLTLLTAINANANILGKYIDGYYTAISFGSASFSPTLGSTDSFRDKNDFAMQFVLGAKINQKLAIELGFANLGSAKVTMGGVDKTISYKETLVGVNFKPLEKPVFIAGKEVTPFVKAGMRRFSTNQPDIRERTHGSYGGVGADIALSEDTAIRAEYVKYSKDADAIFVGFLKNW